jgi:hypothetical protein
MTQYEYVSRSSFAGAGGTPVRFAGKRRLNELLDSMSDNFRRHVKFADFRKPDGIGFAETSLGVRVELLEVTTASNHQSAKRQMEDKISLLLGVVRRAGQLSFPLEVLGTPWAPSGNEFSYPAVPQPGELARWVCYRPTFLEGNLPGVTLYEMHSVAAVQPQQALTAETQQALRTSFSGAKLIAARRGEPVGGHLGLEHSVAGKEIGKIAAKYGLEGAIGAIAACLRSENAIGLGNELAVSAFSLGVARGVTLP